MFFQRTVFFGALVARNKRDLFIVFVFLFFEFLFGVLRGGGWVVVVVKLTVFRGSGSSNAVCEILF
jgi:hypothetical protein